MTPRGQRPLRAVVLRRLMPAAIAMGIVVWSVAAHFAHADRTSRMKETLRLRLELNAAIKAARIEAVTNAVVNAAQNSITLAAMAGQDVNRIVQPYLKTITFAEATAQRIALLDYRARLIVSTNSAPWTPPTDWQAAFDRVQNGSVESLLENDRLVLAAPVVLGSYVEGAMVADISLTSLFAASEHSAQVALLHSAVTSPRYVLKRVDHHWHGEVIWPIGGDSNIALYIAQTMPGGGFWDNPLQASLASVVSLLMAMTAAAIIIAAASVAAPVRRLVDELEQKGLGIGLPSATAPAEIWALTNKFRSAAKDVEQALVREREFTAQQSQFVTMVSHEFRTPLAIIDGATGALRRRRQRMTQKAIDDKLDTVKGAVTRLLRLMESTLSAARLESGGFTIERSALDLRKLVEHLASERQTLDKGVAITLDLARLPDTVAADERLMTSVIENLVSNAAKYGGTPPMIEICGWQDNGDVLLSVTDNGVGIPKDQIARVGEQFYRASTSSGVAGTGVGLNMVRMVMKHHGGRMDVQSELGVGSTFTIRFPIAPPSPDAAPVAHKTAASNDTQPGDLWRMIYVSKAAEFLDDDALAALSEQAGRNNVKMGVTGALACLDGVFAQVLEGRKDRLDTLIDRIEKDPRHKAFQITTQEKIEQRAYDQWRMIRVPASKMSCPLEALQKDIDLRTNH